MQLTSPNPEAALQIKAECERVLAGKALPGVNHVHVEVRQPAGGIGRAIQSVCKAKQSFRWREAHYCHRERQVVACWQIHLFRKSGLRARHHLVRESWFADWRHLRSPSIPLMMGVHEKPTVNAAVNVPVPPSNHGVKVMSIGLLVTDASAGGLARANDHQNDPGSFCSRSNGANWIFCARGFASRHGRRAIFRSGQTVPLDGWRHHQHAAGGVARRRAQGHRDVSESERADPRHRGEHELLHDTERRARGNFRSWRWQGVRCAAKMFRSSAKSRSSSKSAKVATVDCQLRFPRQITRRARFSSKIAETLRKNLMT